MCFKRNKKTDYGEVSRELRDKTFEKLYEFKKYIKTNDRYKFLLNTNWYYDICAKAGFPLNSLSYRLNGEVSESEYKDTKNTCEKISDMLRDEKVSIPDIIDDMKKNSESFGTFCQEKFAMFFVLHPLYGNSKDLYCFSCEKEIYGNTLQLDENGFYKLESSVITTDEIGCVFKTFSSTDYSIRMMTEDEFSKIYLPRRCQANGFTNELDLLKYEKDMNKLFIENTITLKNK